MRQEFRIATSSMTSVPKPLKFLRPHYGTLKAYFKTMSQSDLKNSMADILSVLALTMSPEGETESLKYQLMGSKDDIGSWGHEYMRNWAGEIAQVFQKKQHNDEPEAVDLLMEVMEVKDLEENVEDLGKKILSLVDDTNYKRTCLYIINCSKYLPAPDDQWTLELVYRICMKFSDVVGALRAGFNETTCQYSYVKRVFKATEDVHLKQQLAYIIACHGLSIEIEDDMVADDNQKEALQEICCNSKLSKNYLTLARDIEVMEPKSPEDIYKVPLIDGRDATSSILDSARQNMAATFVNAFVNAGFGQDKLMTSGSSENWLFKNREYGKASAVACLGMILLWNSDSGLDQLDEYLHSDDTDVVAGALLGIGSVKYNCDPALALVRGYISRDESIIRIEAILGLGIAYAGSQKAELSMRFRTILRDSQTPLDVSVFSVVSLGLVFVGFCYRDRAIEDSIIFFLRKRSEAELAEPIIRLLPVALGLLYLGKQLSVEDIAEISETFPEKMKKHCNVTLMSLTYAGTGNVQELLRICSQHLEEGETHQGPAVLGIALIAMPEELGAEMAVHSLEHLLQYSDQNIRRAVLLALPKPEKKQGYLLGCSKGGNKWMLDSAASHHMTGKKRWLKNLRPAEHDSAVDYPLANALKQPIVLDEMGDVDTGRIRVDNVMYSSTLDETEHIISIGRLTDLGFIVIMGNGLFEIMRNSRYEHIVGYGSLDEELMCYPVDFFNEMASLQLEGRVNAGPDGEYVCCEGEWILDSNCPFHMTNRNDWFTDQIGLTGSQVKSSGVLGSTGEIRCLTKATVTGEDIQLKNVYYCDAVQNNLMSAAQLDTEGYGMFYCKDHCRIYWMSDGSLVGRAAKDACCLYYIEYFHARN